MATNWAKLVKEAKPLALGFPFGAYRARILKFEEDRREGSGGTKKNYIDWSIQIIETLDDSAHGKVNQIHKVSLMVDQSMNESRHVAYASAAKGLTFEEFQAIDVEDIVAWMETLQNEKTLAKKAVEVDIICSHQVSDPKYREITFYPVGKSPKESHVYVAVEVPRETKDKETAGKAKETAKTSAPSDD